MGFFRTKYGNGGYHGRGLRKEVRAPFSLLMASRERESFSLLGSEQRIEKDREERERESERQMERETEGQVERIEEEHIRVSKGLGVGE